MSTQAIPDLRGFETHYGVPVSAIGDDGALIALGHHDERTTIAAFSRYSRSTFGFANLLDDRAGSYAEAQDGLAAYWAVLVTSCDEHGEKRDSGCWRCIELDANDWWITYFEVQETPGAFPVMVWDR